MLRLIAGLEEPTSGRVFFDDRDITALGVQDRELGFVFQVPARPAPLAAARREQPALRLRRAGRAARSAPLALRTEWRKAPAAQRRESNRQCLSPSRCPGLPPLTCAPWGLLQGYALFRHMTVADNITFGPRMRKMGIDLDAK